MQPAAGFRGEVEFADTFRPRPGVAHVLFDFDGTLSLLREGWPEVMVPMFAEMLPRRPDESDADVRRLMHDDIMRLNGKQTIYQMMQFAQRVRERGGRPREPLWYKHEYLRRLDERIAGRLAALRDGSPPERYLVHGAVVALELLRARSVTLYLASGTDEAYVRQEAALLGVDRYFGKHVYGALDDYKRFSKQMVIERILRENRVGGDELLAFGDGYVEIQNTKEAGGLAVAVASDEANNGSGRMDPWKRERLRGVGADALVPDYRDAAALLACLFGESPVPGARG
jgi:phosphoglycolate phosphatase-like HAD superfamily hydrolase